MQDTSQCSDLDFAKPLFFLPELDPSSPTIGANFGLGLGHLTLRYGILPVSNSLIAHPEPQKYQATAVFGSRLKAGFNCSESSFSNASFKVPLHWNRDHPVRSAPTSGKKDRQTANRSVLQCLNFWGELTSDHVHMFVSVPPKLAISDLVRKRKAPSSYRGQGSWLWKSKTSVQMA